VANTPAPSIRAQRVSALAAELAMRAGMSRAEQGVARNAALLVEFPPHRLAFPFVAPIFFAKDRGPQEPAFARYVLQLIEVAKAADRTVGLRASRDPVADIVASAAALVDAYEVYLGGRDDPAETILKWFRRRREEGLHSRRAFEAFAAFPRTPREPLIDSAARAGAYPAIAMKAMRAAASEDATLRELTAIAEQDQTLAGQLIAAANCALNPTAVRIATIRHAIAYIGLDQTRRVLTAASMRRMFASHHLRVLWNHSLTVAAWCESLARTTGAIGADEAFLCGLVHDIGRLAMFTAPGEAPETFQRLTERGCDAPFAELILFGGQHGAVGAEILSRWRFPQEIVDGVADHHESRLSRPRISAMLYLAECANGERTPSMAHDGAALEILGIGQEAVSMNRAEVGTLDGLMAA
jgi:putative nucleotidyltransferase with HDIG domain